ncbi:hypothetical protein E2C01_078223 [Portunus trituberculatus]|uniref:Uncharacterized protein n=1 Tax=Portunus trituberculatus TaxID=210409 RepID=A0A5B7IDF4_PORTR|nr:hypothetical protein [Portunus trituberculatus]
MVPLAKSHLRSFTLTRSLPPSSGVARRNVTHVVPQRCVVLRVLQGRERVMMQWIYLPDDCFLGTGTCLVTLNQYSLPALCCLRLVKSGGLMHFFSGSFATRSQRSPAISCPPRPFPPITGTRFPPPPFTSRNSILNLPQEGVGKSCNPRGVLEGVKCAQPVIFHVLLFTALVSPQFLSVPSLSNRYRHHRHLW